MIPQLATARLVLMPHGPPISEEDLPVCMQQILWCGGDIGRIVDRPNSSVDAFVRYVSRIGGILDGSETALVVLTRTNPLALTVVETRRKLTAAIPSLNNARWVIFLNVRDDPFFVPTAMRLGYLSGELSAAPHWVGPGASRFVVLTSTISDQEVVLKSLDLFDELELAKSGVRRAR